MIPKFVGRGTGTRAAARRFLSASLQPSNDCALGRFSNDGVDEKI
jgi:hypothetical protein